MNIFLLFVFIVLALLGIGGVVMAVIEISNAVHVAYLRWRHRDYFRQMEVTKALLGYEGWLESQFDEEFEPLPGVLEIVDAPDGRREPQ